MFYTSSLLVSFSLEFGWKQLSSGLQDSSQYSCQWYCGLDGFDFSSDFQLFPVFFQIVVGTVGTVLKKTVLKNTALKNTIGTVFLRTVPTVPTTICVSVNFTFHFFFHFMARSKYLFFFFFFAFFYFNCVIHQNSKIYYICQFFFSC